MDFGFWILDHTGESMFVQLSIDRFELRVLWQYRMSSEVGTGSVNGMVWFGQFFSLLVRYIPTTDILSQTFDLILFAVAKSTLS
jgi:hypothetical protein